MRLALIIIAACVVILAFVGGGAFYYFEMRPDPAAQAENKPAPKPQFVSLKPLVVNLRTPDQGQGQGQFPMRMSSGSTYLQVGFQFSTTDAGAISAFDDMRPAIRGNVLDLLLQQSADVITSHSKRQQMKDAVLKVVNQTVTSAGADNADGATFSKVYVTRFVTQPG